MHLESTLERRFNLATQFFLPILTLGGMLMISLKHPGIGLALSFLAQPFWLYSTYRAWKREGQIGMFVNTLAYTCITGFGVINYYFLS